MTSRVSTELSRFQSAKVDRYGHTEGYAITSAVFTPPSSS